MLDDLTFEHHEACENTKFVKKNEKLESTVIGSKMSRGFTINNILKSELNEDKPMYNYMSTNDQKTFSKFEVQTCSTKISLPEISKSYHDKALHIREEDDRALFLRKKGASPSDLGKLIFNFN